jgi:hypothetical protein
MEHRRKPQGFDFASSHPLHTSIQVQKLECLDSVFAGLGSSFKAFQNASLLDHKANRG